MSRPNNASIRALLHHRAVESINLDLRGYTDLQENLLLQELVNQQELHCLALRASSITDTFWKFAERPLTEVHFFECQNLTNALFLLLENHCPLLEKLSVTSAPRVTAVGKALSLFAAAEPLVFGHLNSLNLSKNVQLKELHLQAPHLVHLFASKCIKLETINLIEQNTLKICDIRGSNRFGEDQLQALWRQHTTLKSIKAKECKHIAYPEMLETLQDSSLTLRIALISAYLHSDDPKALNLRYLELGSGDIQVLSALTQLTSLDLRENNIGAEGARALSALTQLTSLHLRENQIGAEGARALSALTQLTSLDLGYNKIGDEGVRALSSLTQLTSLDLTGNNIGAEGARALSALTQLTSLNLGFNKIQAGGARALSALTQLTSLNLGGNKIGAGGARALSALTQLTSLNLRENQIEAEGARALSALTQLTSLDLGYNNIEAEGARALSALTQLTSLDLGYNNIGAEGARALSALTQLTSLGLQKNNILYIPSRHFLKKCLPKTQIYF